MADYIVSNDFKTMEEIWDDILRLHWEYLDTEENMEKLNMRRKLEGVIFVFPHNPIQYNTIPLHLFLPFR